ncbi:MAG: IS110 family transposase [Rikenellaceae bacterium]
MENIIKQGVGIDISKSTFTACLCTKLASGKTLQSSVEEFANNKNGFNQLLKWVSKLVNKKCSAHYAMEATGVYHEGLAEHLHKAKKKVSVILPTTVKYFARSLNEKSKTDAIDALIIAKMVSERDLECWIPPRKEFAQLRELSRFRGLLMNDRTRYKNVMEALTHSIDTPKDLLTMTQRMIDGITKQIEKCEKEMTKIVKADEDLKCRFDAICTIPGVGFITAISVIAETKGFELFKNRKQVASYAGYDVVERQSGVSVKGKSKISKRGNARIRQCLYMPSLTASRGIGFSALYQRIISQGKPSSVGLVAVARKMLLLIYTLWKSGETFVKPTQNIG